MAEKRSVFTEVSQELGEALAKARRDSDKSKATPFGMEQVTADVEARRLLEMGAAEVAAYLKEHGLQKTLEVARRGRKHA